MKIYRNVFKSANGLFWVADYVFFEEEEAHKWARDRELPNGETDTYQYTIVEEVETINIKNETGDPKRPNRKRGGERV